MLIPIDIGDIVAGKYVVEGTLGKGGMGVVFAARHVELDHRVAIKVLRTGVLDSDEAHARFLQEARALAKFQSDYLVRVFDVGRLENGTPYMVMEHLEGSDLSSVLKTRGSLPVSEAVDYVVQACAGLAEAHASGVVHRDLKPGNLFLAERLDGTRIIKVIDFGIAKSLIGQAKLTRDSMVLGSPTYMSPEQLRSARDVDARTDVWALGIILYKLLTSTTPFPSDDMGGHLRAIRASAPPHVRENRPEVDEALDDAILRCLRVEREERTQSVIALAEEIAPFGTSVSRECCERLQRISTRPAPDSASDDGFSSASAPNQADVPPSESGTRREGAGAFPPPPAAGVPELPVASDPRPPIEPTISDPPPSPAQSSSRARPVVMTVDATIPAAPALPVALIPPAPPVPPIAQAKSPGRPWLYWGVGVSVVGAAVAAAVYLTVQGGLVPIASPAGASTATHSPLPPGDATRVDAQQLYPVARDLARKLAPGARLVRIDVDEDNTRGLADLPSGASIEYIFESGVGADGKPSGNIEVRVSSTGLDAKRLPSVGEGRAVPEPRCPASRVWNAAVASGLGPDTIASLHYGARPGAASWVVDVPNRPELKREVDDSTCAARPIPP